ncbi:cytochrome P450 2D14-like [Pleurodeles waltl]|uniref:cytochrome P450 2D14-like n=1 Tax=Pleurodeles waltl TaxID=8319 RepID=UPI00370937EC
MEPPSVLPSLRPSYYSSLSLLTLFFAVFFLCLDFMKRRKRWRGYPPGPPSLPFLGNMLQVDFSNPAVSFDKLRKKYGNIFSLQFCWTNVVVLNEFVVMKEALINKSEDIADRPPFPIFEHLGFQEHSEGVLVARYGRAWKEQRRFSLATLRNFGLGKKSLEERIREEAGFLCSEFASEEGHPFDPHFVINNAVSNVICSITFGDRFEYVDNKFRRLLHLFEESLKAETGFLPQVSAHQKKDIWRAIAKDVRTLGVHHRRSTHCWKRWEDICRWSKTMAEAQLVMASQLEYIDDLLIASKARDDSKYDTIALLNHLGKNGHKVSPKKLQYCQKEVKYLGHLIEKGSRKISKESVTALLQMNPPTTRRDVRMFLGMVGYCPQWILNFSVISKPLVKLTVQDGPDVLTLTEKEMKAFTELLELYYRSITLGLGLDRVTQSQEKDGRVPGGTTSTARRRQLSALKGNHDDEDWTTTLPDAWKHAEINPLLKKPSADPTELKNYRAMSVLPFPAMVIKKAINAQLTDFIEINDILDPSQSGFRSKHSIETALLAATDDSCTLLDCSKTAALILLDLSSAFNTVTHTSMCTGLHDAGIHSKALEWIRYFLSVQTQRILNVVPALVHIPGLVGKLFQPEKELLKFIRDSAEEHKATRDPSVVRDLIDAFLEEIEKEILLLPQAYNLLLQIRHLLAAGSFTILNLCYPLTQGCKLNPQLLHLLRYVFVEFLQVAAERFEQGDQVHQEIDQVIGQNRRPVMEDQASMPFTNAVIHETQRYGDILPVALPHMAYRDTWIQGFFIPKGTTVITNLSSVLKDETVWEKPHQFYPQHFLDKDGNFVKREAFMAFSAGRRVCLGEQLAKMELFLFFTTLLQSFTFTSPEGQPGPKEDAIFALTRSPYSYQICATMR